VVEIAATALFAAAVLHTFLTRYFEHLARIHPRHAGLWHLFGEVETVFGIWALLLIAFMALYAGPSASLHYLESRTFTEPAFIFVIMVIAASRPIIDFAGAALRWFAALLPIQASVGYYFSLLFIGPLLGSFITEPAAMTLSALLLRQRYFSAQAPRMFKYGTIGVLFVNVSIGGTLTPFAAPPVLMVADRWGWDIAFTLQTFGWKAASTVFVNAAMAAFLFRRHLSQLPAMSAALGRLDVPLVVIAIHVAFLAAVVVSSHHLVIFVVLFLFFLGYVEAYRRHQSRLIIREALMVSLFLGGLVVLGGLQGWWLGPLLANMGSSTLYYGATALTAVTDNAALTYLGSLVSGLSPEAKYALVAGAVSGGGLTVIANAPNPAGFAILKDTFDDGAIDPWLLALAAAGPTVTAMVAFQLLPG
jgi:hypothetical protein